MSRNPYFHNLIDDIDIRSMKPPCSEQELHELEHNILTKGYDNSLPITVWRRIILDGYKRYDICKKHHITCRITTINFSLQEEAISWICRNELKRQFLSESYQKYYIGKLYHAQKVVFSTLYPAQNQSTSKSLKRPPIKKEYDNRNYTASLVGQEYHISPGTVYKYGIFTKDMDIIMQKSPVIAAAIMSDRVHVSHTNITELADLSKEDLEKLEGIFLANGVFHVQLSDIDHLLNRKPAPVKVPVKNTEPEIKHMPKYDPDSEVSSLTLTIPSWISSIQRTRSNAQFHLISQGAKDKLQQQLWELQTAIVAIAQDMKEK